MTTDEKKNWLQEGDEFLNGIGHDSDFVKAFQCYKNGLLQNKENKQSRDQFFYRLFHCYRYGLGVKKNIKFAKEITNAISSTKLKAFLNHKLVFDPEDCSRPPSAKVLRKCNEFRDLGEQFPEIYYYCFRAQEEYHKLYDQKQSPQWELIKLGAEKKDVQCQYRLLSEQFPAAPKKPSPETLQNMIQLANETGNIMAAWELAKYYGEIKDKKNQRYWATFALGRLKPTAHDACIGDILSYYLQLV